MKPTCDVYTTKHNLVEGYNLYLQMTGGILALASVAWYGICWLLWPGLSQGHVLIGVIVEIILGLFPIACWIGWGVLALASWMGTMFSPRWLRWSHRGLFAFFPLVVLLGRSVGVHKDRLRQSLISLLNHLVLSNHLSVPAEKVLLLTPHCLQQQRCVHKVTSLVDNCKQCGQCQVGDLLALSRRVGCQFVVVTGGTLARLEIKKRRPKAIIAIACERDLVSGMSDVFPIPVIGVLNERPEGPCCNTRVDMERIEKVVELICHGHEPKATSTKE